MRARKNAWTVVHSRTCTNRQRDGMWIFWWYEAGADVWRHQCAKGCRTVHYVLRETPGGGR